MPANLCTIVTWTEFADLYPGQATISFGESLRFNDPSWMSETQCSATYGNPTSPTGLRITAKIKVYRDPLHAPISYDGIAKVDFSKPSLAAKAIPAVGPAKGYTYTDPDLGVTVVAVHRNLITQAWVNSDSHSVSHSTANSATNVIPANSLQRLTTLITALIAKMPIQLRPRTGDPILTALARQAATGPAPRITAASVHSVVEAWTREDNNSYTGQRITSWRAPDGSGFVDTMTLPPSRRFTSVMPGRILFDYTAIHSRQTFGAGQMPHHTQWPATLSADPRVMLQQLHTIWPIQTPAGLMRALRLAHTRYVITREVRAATLTLLATTDGVTARLGDIPTYAQDNTPTAGLILTADDTLGHITFHLDLGTGFLHSAVEHAEHSSRSGRGRLVSYLVYLESSDRMPR